MLQEIPTSVLAVLCQFRGNGPRSPDSLVGEKQVQTPTILKAFGQILNFMLLISCYLLSPPDSDAFGILTRLIARAPRHPPSPSVFVTEGLGRGGALVRGRGAHGATHGGGAEEGTLGVRDGESSRASSRCAIREA